jgi:hypothetical protein
MNHEVGQATCLFLVSGVSRDLLCVVDASRPFLSHGLFRDGFQRPAIVSISIVFPSRASRFDPSCRLPRRDRVAAERLGTVRERAPSERSHPWRCNILSTLLRSVARVLDFLK